MSQGANALKALILNGLGFMNDRLYLVEQFFQDKPIDRLIGPGIVAEHLNDDVLGDLQDAIHAYGSTRLYSELAFEIGLEQNLIGRSNHLDTTTLSLFGRYESEGKEVVENDEHKPGSPKVTYGHSKDHRPDLKQLTLYLIVNGKASFPLCLKDPWFLLDSVFLKNPSRIEALMMIMTLCLMVYNVGQHWLRLQLQQNDETLPNQVGKPVNNPTWRWVFRLLQGISVVEVIFDQTHKIIQQMVSNIDELKCQIIKYFGSIAIEIYGIR